MIRWAIDKNCRIYDFRGTASDDPPKESDPGYGVYRFKKSFNPEYIRMIGYYDYIFSCFFYKLFISIEKYLFPHLPLLLKFIRKK